MMATLQCSRCGGTRYDTSHRCEKGCGVMTATNEATIATLDGLRKRLEQVEAERDAFEDMARGMSADLSAIGEDRDALAAHLERIKERKYRLESKGIMPARLAGIIDESHNTSLARRDARMKAEALDLAALQLSGKHAEAIGRIRDLAADYRKQAEGGGDE